MAYKNDHNFDRAIAFTKVNRLTSLIWTMFFNSVKLCLKEIKTNDEFHYNNNCKGHQKLNLQWYCVKNEDHLGVQLIWKVSQMTYALCHSTIMCLDKIVYPA